MFTRRSETQQIVANVTGSRNMIIESHVGNTSEPESSASTDISQSSKASDFSPHLSGNVIMPNLSEQYQKRGQI